jgi:hypothetical protein
MQQSKLESSIEVCLNTASGFVISWCVYRYIVFPYMLTMSVDEQAWWITALFTVVSIFRSYFWRRFFASGVHKLVHSLARRYFAGYGSVK